jgi:hypothetical protein
MAFTVQGSSPVDGANAYVTVAFFDAYHGDRGSDVSALSTTEKEQAIVRATDYLDLRWQFIGERLTLQQTTAWPRRGAEDRDGFFRFDIPIEIQEACAEYALLSANGTDLNPIPDRDTTGQRVQQLSEKVGPISESRLFVAGSVFVLPVYPPADRKLLSSGLVSTSHTVRRA